ncbi:SDR family NAD(P)-dependent oxidoreductase [Staphylococcus epidermidis]|nr:SDR family NAD(P)-dependent oxidoreductase [Staphylococcus epidermidis]MCG2331576.1 SDR family NAD(P)-dependent oxidoreductase [Staphylococcus epidermidis]MCG2353659.1 SDR family NAD(P)-dependent oxidoreductase [Staphylococcus epidermidis]MCG2358193.1 SDR family NAD(P)-dependent oxidoreductase [Staphylococcus epidermidis]MCG2365168.1 SDR family NAD(P)-dependent oxidoreductase [Staphylococcus epidermidis]
MIGKHFIITGATSGLGFAITNELLQRGAHVTILARNIDKFNRIKENYFKPEHINVIKCDLMQRKDIESLQKFLTTPINGFIYSSGVGYFKSISEHSTREVLETYEVNLINFNLLYKVIQPQLVKAAYIVGISSQAALVSQANATHYGASKAGFSAVLNALRLEQPELKVLNVQPGPIDTPFHKNADPTLKYLKNYRHMMIQPQQLAKQIVEGIILNKIEINQPSWMQIMLKFYQLCPRTLEKLCPNLFKNKV